MIENDKIVAVPRAQIEAIVDQIAEIQADVAAFNKDRPRIKRPDIQVVKHGTALGPSTSDDSGK